MVVERDEEIERMRKRIARAVQRRNELTFDIREATTRREKDRLDLARQPVREELKEAKKELNQKTARWEKEWWEEILNNCSDAGEKGDKSTVYKHLKKLGSKVSLEHQRPQTS